jgi:predicted alpha/beta hydrolase family esterase
VSGYHTDLGDEGERESGYFSTPWNWDAIRSHQRFILQFASSDDHLVPISEARYVHEKLQTQLFEFQDRGHFNYEDTFPELFDALVARIKQSLVEDD